MCRTCGHCNRKTWLRLLPSNMRPSRRMRREEICVLWKRCCDFVEIVCPAQRLLCCCGVWESYSEISLNIHRKEIGLWNCEELWLRNCPSDDKHRFFYQQGIVVSISIFFFLWIDVAFNNGIKAKKKKKLYTSCIWFFCKLFCPYPIESGLKAPIRGWRHSRRSLLCRDTRGNCDLSLHHERKFVTHCDLSSPDCLHHQARVTFCRHHQAMNATTTAMDGHLLRILPTGK